MLLINRWLVPFILGAQCLLIFLTFGLCCAGSVETKIWTKNYKNIVPELCVQLFHLHSRFQFWLCSWYWTSYQAVTVAIGGFVHFSLFCLIQINSKETETNHIDSKRLLMSFWDTYVFAAIMMRMFVDGSPFVVPGSAFDLVWGGIKKSDE